MKQNALLIALLGLSLCVQATPSEKQKSMHDQVLKTELVQNIKWLNVPAVRLAFDDMKQNKQYDIAKYEPMMLELEALNKAGFSGVESGNSAAKANLKKATALKKQILFGNPLLSANKIVASRYKLGDKARKLMAPSMGTQSNNWTNQESARRVGFDAEIVELSDWATSLQKRTVYKPTNGSPIADLKMHWDATRVMFTATEEDKRWNIWEAKLDGSGAEPMVKIPEEDIEFYDGTYLPDGRFIAISNIGYQGVPCINGSGPVGNMVLCDAAKESFRRITFDQDANWGPTVMNNGRVIYTRWEYTDLMHYYSRFVMHMNPDGTEQKALSGSGSAFPNSTFDVQPLPGHSSAFVATISGHHGVARSGRMLLFDPAKARSGVEGVMQEIPYRGRPIDGTVKDQLVNGVWPQFIKPMPIDDKYFLVSAKLSPTSLWGIYLVDVFDNITCIAEAEGEGYISPILVRKQTTPPVIPDRVDLKKKDATVFIQDIYEGEGLRGVPRGTVKELRLHSYEYAFLHSPSNHDAHGIQSGWDIKRLLGTVPVEEDGSVIFTIPANTPISMQPLDEHGAAIQWMRSWLTAQPGEVVSCVGCHEDQNDIAMPKRVLASQKSPHAITPPAGGVHAISFDLDVQPVLDRACIACHNNEKAFDLRGGKKDPKGYGTSYLNLHPYVHRQGSEADMAVLQPYEYYANTSELIRLLKKGHANVQLTDNEWKALYNWIDYNAPDNAVFKHTKPKMTPYKGLNQYTRRIELAKKYANGISVDYEKELADYANYLKSQGEIKPVVNAAKKVKTPKVPKVKGWPIEASITAMLQTKVVQLAPGVQMTFVKVPAGEFVMGSNKGMSDNKPAIKAAVEKSFWMAEVEVTNKQYAVFSPEHDSRYVDQQWKDHIHNGYPANKPEQPVIRVNYNEALAYCEALSKQTGLKITLPTETQWEWACRAGADTDFWFGDMNADFGSKENFADKQTLKMAVTGVDPQPMNNKQSYYGYHTYLPKEESVDDGAMIQIDSKTYDANPFGLYSMHGNIAEWTKSDYVSYAGKKNAVCLSCNENNADCTCDAKVVRGGSYIERPKFGTAYARKGFYPHQKVFNVGFRLIIED